MVDAVGRPRAVWPQLPQETPEHRPVDALRRAPMARRCALRVAAVMGCEFDVCAVGRCQENALKFGRGTAELLLYSNISGCVLQVGQHCSQCGDCLTAPYRRPQGVGPNHALHSSGFSSCGEWSCAKYLALRSGCSILKQLTSRLHHCEWRSLCSTYYSTIAE